MPPAVPAPPARPRPPPLDARARAALDDEAGLADSTRWFHAVDGSRRAETRLALSGLYCAGCAGVIEGALRALPGVEQAEVQGSAERARVCWRPDALRASQLVEAVRAAGYDAHPARSEAELDARAREGRRALWRLFVAWFCMMQVMMVATPSYVSGPGELAPDLEQLLRWGGWVLSLPVMLFSAGPFFASALRGLRHGRVVMDLPVALGLLIAFFASTAATFEPGPPGPGGELGGEVWFDSLTMFVAFLLTGRWLELRGRERVARALDSLLRELPDSVERRGPDGRIETVAVARLALGDTLRLQPGQAVPADGLLVEGRSSFDEALLNGESRPVPRGPGEAVVAGSLNLAAPVWMRVQALGADTRRAQIVELMERARSARPALARTADRWAGPFLLGVLLLAAGAWAVWQQIDPARALPVAVAVLIVTCPCALSLAAPATLLAAAGGLARRGVLVQRLDAIEALARIDTACFDKTGTLSEDPLQLAEIRGGPAEPEARAAWIARAVALAAGSSHPLSRALAQAGAPATAAAEPLFVGDRVDEPGAGLAATGPDGRVWRLGSAAWVGPQAEALAETPHPAGPHPHGPPPWRGRPVVFLAPQPLAAGEQPLAFAFDERLREGALPLLAALHAEGLALELLSGDRPAAVQAFGARLREAGAPALRLQGAATPQRKLARLQELQAEGRRVLMVGDGLNDGPVLAQADVSVALGHGAALSQQQADLVVLGSRLPEIAAARQRARKALAIVRENLVWALLYNLLALPLAMSGTLAPWAAGLGMAFSSLFVVGNALRAGR